MKIRYFLVATSLMVIARASFGQVTVDVNSPVKVLGADDIFNQGVWNFNLNQNLDFLSMKTSEDGDKTGTYSLFDSRIEANYFLIDHLAVGLGVRLSNEKTTNTLIDPESVEKINVAGGYLNVLYGTNVGGVINIVTKATVGTGQVKYVSDYGFGENETKDKYLTLGLSVGTPIELSRNVYFTPYLGYEYRKTSDDDYKEKRNSATLGLRMDFFMGCGDDECDLSDNPISVNSRFRQGELLLGSKMFGHFQVGGQNTTYEGEGEYTQKDGFGNSSLSGFALFYILNNLGVGAGIDSYCDRSNSKDTEYKTRQGEFTVNPIIRYHVPVGTMLRNLYAEGSVGFGINSSKTVDDEEEYKEKSSVMNWKIGAGYHYFVAEHFSLSPFAGYGGNSLKYKDDDYKTSKSGLYAGIGWNFHLR
jgi:hypothetical protein